MADKMKVWFDAEADFLEVRFSDAAGYEKETAHDAVMQRVAVLALSAWAALVSMTSAAHFGRDNDARGAHFYATLALGVVAVVSLGVLLFARDAWVRR